MRRRNDDMRSMLRRGTSALAFTGIAACTACASDAGPPSPPPAPSPAVTSLATVTEQALADAARRSGLKRADLKVLSAEAVTWPDGSLGCPEPGRMYAQALVPGYRVTIGAGDQVLDYHAGRGGGPAFCPADRARDPLQDART